jgi:hypothetical protein
MFVIWKVLLKFLTKYEAKEGNFEASLVDLLKGNDVFFFLSPSSPLQKSSKSLK